MAGQPCRWGGVAAPNVARNQEATTGKKPSSPSSSARAKIASVPWEGVRAAGGSGTPPEPERSQRDQRAARALSLLIDRDDDLEDADVPARHQ